MTGLATSVIIVSRGRPDRLPLCLAGLSQLWHENFEIVVVADPGGVRAAAPWASRIKLVPFDEPNIASARNLGIAAAAGDIVAFIDDDAVPEPTWLAKLTAPFEEADVVQTGGYVRGRNGISFQWRARMVDRMGQAKDIPSTSEKPFRPDVGQGFVVKTEGTNMAFRRTELASIGGFDPGYRFYLDETDVNMRLAPSPVVIVPDAQVHHAYAASPIRKSNRAVRNLTEIGASTARFLTKHAGQDMLELGWNRLYSEQKDRLLRQAEDGLIRRGDVDRLLAGLAAGFKDGRARPVTPLTAIPASDSAFRRFEPTSTGEAVFLAGRAWSRQTLLRRARKAVRGGSVATVLSMTHTPQAHRVRFRKDGVWEQSGGLYGPSDRDQPRFRWWSFRKRVDLETERLGNLRK